MTRNVLAAGLALALCACSDPVAPDREKPPEPKAATAATAEAASADGALAASIQVPLDRARGAQATVDAAATSQREAIDHAEAGTDAASPAAP